MGPAQHRLCPEGLGPERPFPLAGSWLPGPGFGRRVSPCGAPRSLLPSGPSVPCLGSWPCGLHPRLLPEFPVGVRPVPPASTSALRLAASVLGFRRFFRSVPRLAGYLSPSDENIPARELIIGEGPIYCHSQTRKYDERSDASAALFWRRRLTSRAPLPGNHAPRQLRADRGRRGGRRVGRLGGRERGRGHGRLSGVIAHQIELHSGEFWLVDHFSIF